VGILIAVEGVDGAGKQTLTRAIARELEDRGKDVIRVGFPRYGESVHADLAAEALRGEHGDLSESVYAMATMFALDRHAALGELQRQINRHDVVLLDRYVASNAAYSAARLRQDAEGEVVKWVRELEFERFGLPKPDMQLLVSVPVEIAQARAKRREKVDQDRARDSYERDSDLQARTAAIYGQLAEQGWISPWHAVSNTAEFAGAATQHANELVNQLFRA
jgi:dTMP kinase